MTMKIDAGDFALIRQPLLTMELFTHWRVAQQSPNFKQAQISHEQFVLKQFEQPLLDEALYISSPTLHQRLTELRQSQGSATQDDSENRKLVASLAKFLSRAAFRCTPFGMFAQVKLARYGDGNFQSNALPTINRGIFLDSGIEARLVEDALSNHSLREQLTWQISTTAFLVGQHISYVDWVYQKLSHRQYRAVELIVTEALLQVHSFCQHAREFTSIAELMAHAIKVELRDAKLFLHRLIDMRLLLPQLAPTASTKCSLTTIVEKAPIHPATSTLREVHRQLNDIRGYVQSPFSNTQKYQKLQATIADVLGTQEVSRGVLQIDSIDIEPAQIKHEQIQHIIQVVTLFATHLRRKINPLAEYKRLFRERFEDREVNLAYALHEEQGVPFPSKGNVKSPLLDGLQWDGIPVSSESNENPGLSIQNVLVQRLFELRGASGPIYITEQDLIEASTSIPPSGTFAEGMFAHVEVLQGVSPEDELPTIELRSISGSNGLELLTRFCHLSPELNAAVQSHQSALSDSREAQAIYAEIIHHPQDRLLNVLRRPRMSTHELVFAGASDLPREQQIWINDLSIKLVNDRFELRDRRSGRRVIPRLSSAHNYSNNQLGMYQFLATLQDDGAALMAFKWPKALENLPYLPRVELCRCILSRAQWKLQKSDIVALNKASVELDVGSWRATRKMPRFVTWDVADNRLPIDLDNIASVGILLDEIIKLDTTILYECPALNMPLENGLGTIRNQEWIIPLTIQKPILNQITEELSPSNSEALTSSQQLNAEGLILSSTDNYMYMRIYTGSGYSDSLLREYIGPVILQEQADGHIDHWFVVRYRDNFEHLRLRFCGHNQTALLAAMNKLQMQLQRARQNGLLWKILTDDYVPEVKRYGGLSSLRICEQLFCLDSQDLLFLLDLEAQHDIAHKRWLFSLISLDFYMDCLSDSQSFRENLLQSLSKQFNREHKITASQQIAIGARFRELRSDIDTILSGTGPALPLVQQWQRHLQTTKKRRLDCVEVLRKSQIDESVFIDICKSLVHMHCNRLSPSEPRRFETLLYDFACRLDRARTGQRRQHATVPSTS